MQDKLGYPVGITMIGRVLRGSKDKKLLELGLQELSTYGLIRTQSRTEIKAIAAQLEADGYLQTEPEHQTVLLTQKAFQVLFQGRQVQMLVRKEPEVAPVKALTAQKLTWEESELYDMLRKLRAKLAQESNVPAYVIFSNATLQDMARKRPRNTTEFKHINGVGEMKALWYAEPFLREIKLYLEEHPE